MEFRLLGPLEVWHEGREIAVRGGRQRALLAVLLLHANDTVSSDRLLDELWGDEPPDARTAALRVRVSQLRKALDVGGDSPIVTRAASGYALETSPDRLDLLVFERKLDEARAADAATAADLLRDALTLWRGPALADFAYEPFAQAAIGRLEELRLLAIEQRVDADLALGREAELVPELEALMTEHPLRERLRGQLMLALYRAGRQAEALEAFQRGKTVLVEQLGLDPAPALQELERAILRHDPLLNLPSAAAQRSILVAWSGDIDPGSVLAVAEALAQKPRRELILARIADEPAALGDAVSAAGGHVERLRTSGVVARAASLTGRAAGSDTARLAVDQDVDLLLVAASERLLDDPDLQDLMRAAPCDVGLVAGGVPSSGPVLVPFAGGEHDWGAIELGAWLAGSWGESLLLAGPSTEGGDSSRLLANASLAVQRALGVVAEPVLVQSGAALVEVARDSAVAVIGLSDRWRDEGLGPVRGAVAASGHATVVVRKGLRPGGLAPAEHLTRFTWSLRV